jgi:hypothetical protein
MRDTALFHAIPDTHVMRRELGRGAHHVSMVQLQLQYSTVYNTTTIRPANARACPNTYLYHNFTSAC